MALPEQWRRFDSSLLSPDSCLLALSVPGALGRLGKAVVDLLGEVLQDLVDLPRILAVQDRVHRVVDRRDDQRRDVADRRARVGLADVVALANAGLVRDQLLLPEVVLGIGPWGERRVVLPVVGDLA